MKLSKNQYIIGGIILALFFVFILWQVPQWQSDAYRAKFTYEDIQKLEQKDRIQLEKSASDIENSTRLTLAQIIGGLALLSGLYFTYQNVKTAQKNLLVTEEGKITERFSNAVELLGSDKLDVRLGGIYALERIARDSQKDHWTVMEVLTAFVRENSHKKIKEEENIERNLRGQKDSWTQFVEREEEVEDDERNVREDIQTIMTVIGRRKWIDTENGYLNLRRVNLEGYNLYKANLSKADLIFANLFDADLSESILIETNFSSAEMSGANLYKANLTNAILWRARLYDSNMEEAILTGATLYKTKLFGAAYLTPQQILSAENLGLIGLSEYQQEELDKYKVENNL
jgi:Pentapeptide repeats (8 copies)